jgi:transcriptional regulator with XRE-family HTH domain
MIKRLLSSILELRTARIQVNFEEMAMTLGERIRARREELGLRPTDLADAVGVSVSAVLYWESGATKNLKNEHLFVLADRLKVNARWLAIGQGPKRLGAAMRAAMLLCAWGVMSLLPPPTQAAEPCLGTAPVYYVKLRRFLAGLIPSLVLA